LPFAVSIHSGMNHGAPPCPPFVAADDGMAPSRVCLNPNAGAEALSRNPLNVDAPATFAPPRKFGEVPEDPSAL
jgi:hypothetical protein